MLKIENLSKSYGSKRVLSEIDLNFNPGEVVGIVGANGAGKTTLFNCISGLVSYHGNITYQNGVLKNTLGFLPTTPYMLSRITGLEYLKLMLAARGVEVDIRKKNIFGLPLNEYAENYSTGMKKKLAITGVLLQPNDVFIFDEPFNGVDIQSNIIINEAILKLKQKGKIILMSSHIFSTLEAVCDWMFVLEDGKTKPPVERSKFKEIEAAMLQKGIKAELDDFFA